MPGAAILELTSSARVLMVPGKMQQDVTGQCIDCAAVGYRSMTFTFITAKRKLEFNEHIKRMEMMKITQNTTSRDPSTVKALEFIPIDVQQAVPFPELQSCNSNQI